jgi:excisionase family DNA binding protein
METELEIETEEIKALPEWCTKEELWRRLRWHRNFVAKLIAQGELEGTYLPGNRRFLIPRSAVARYVQRRQEELRAAFARESVVAGNAPGESGGLPPDGG